MARFQNKICLVTGAGSDIGKATAIAFAQEGGKVVVSDVNEKSGQEVLILLESMGYEAIFIICDISKRMGQPSEVADVALWLSSEQSSFITGHAMPVDGGELPDAQWHFSKNFT